MPQTGSPALRLLEKMLECVDGLSSRLKGGGAAKHLDIGRHGEDKAFFHLRSLGYTVVARDWRSAKLRGDIDLIAWDGDTLCFIEVKTRTSRDFATPESAVDEEKCRMLRALGRQYLRVLATEPAQVRIDILSICLERNGAPRLDLYRGAVDWN